MTTQTSIQWLHLAPNPTSFYRQLFIKGTRVRARVLYGMYMSGEGPMTPGEIAADFGLSLEAVQEAIAYCQTNPHEIEDDMRREELLLEATGMNNPDGRAHGQPKPLTAQEMARIRES
jgi:uncharacterized protein (DUF433 family)